MSSKNGVPFRQNLVGSWNYGAKCPYSMDADSVTIHETDNNAPADNEIRYMIGNTAQVSYHVAIDEKEAVQGIPFDRNSWNAGDGGSGHGNRKSISFEICRNYDPTRGTTNISGTQLEQYKKAKANAIKVIAQVMLEQGIPANVNTVKSHYDRSGKNCPSKMRNDGDWTDFRDAVIAEYNRLKNGSSGGGSTDGSASAAIKVGENVKVVGNLFADADGKGASSKSRGKSAKIDKLATGKKKPYHLTGLGWAAASDLSSPNAKTVTIDSLNVYTSQSLSSAIVKTANGYRILKKGTKVKVTGTLKGQSVHGSTSWSEVDGWGWVPSVYLM
ncbi:N-acetylmuramoyl-L-alanine amidase [Candidatus Enterococcus leclercqii]|uniref:N-acetylmuramoyl-L-alanine amidase n=1 Tax=Candidatus Enterococcus leclercqii TaxID=1857218 RepID=UPI00137B6B2E|nr:N-acetylmuramoyl-L-alanine amidase [Enterococcus sp. CU9D]KAF1291039.1 hypothetical protein BAU14_10625 [Enterococcus sp. CU9D]